MDRDYQNITLKRVYDPVAKYDGIRLLADRLWPRGISKVNLAYDQWIKDLCPSTILRKQWHQGEMDYETFCALYVNELADKSPEILKLCQSLPNKPITLLSAVRDIEHSHLPVLRDVIYETMETAKSPHSNERASPVCYQQDTDSNSSS